MQPRRKTTKKNRRIELSVCKTVNLGDYNSLKIQCSLAQDISDSADLAVEYQDLFESVAQEVMDKIQQSTEE